MATHQNFLPEERAELARRLREGMVSATTSAQAQAAAIDIAVSYGLEIAVRFTNEQSSKLAERFERDIRDLRRQMGVEVDALRSLVTQLEARLQQPGQLHAVR